MPCHIVCLTFDFDTQAGFIARGMTTPAPLSRGEFDLVGAARILDLLKTHGIRATWFTPGFTIESHPEMCARVVEAGHEIGHHGWSHVAPAAMTRDEEEADLVRATAAIRRLTGAPAVGYRSPARDLGANTLSLLEAQGFLYDSSLMGADYWPYRVRKGDVAELGKPYVKGPETGLIEMPISWTLDDHPHVERPAAPQDMMPGLQPARAVMQDWLDEFLYMRKSVSWGVLTCTMHPCVIGRGFRMLAFEDFLGRLIAGGAVFTTMAEAAREARERLGWSP